MARENTPDGKADPKKVIDHLRDVFNTFRPTAPEPSPLDDLPLDPLADMETTRAVIARWKALKS